MLLLFPGMALANTASVETNTVFVEATIVRANVSVGDSIQAIVNRTCTIDNVQANCVRAMTTALQLDRRTHLLSAPSLYTPDSKEAMIRVGDRGDGGRTLELRVTPTVLADGRVSLDSTCRFDDDVRLQQTVVAQVDETVVIHSGGHILLLTPHQTTEGNHQMAEDIAQARAELFSLLKDPKLRRQFIRHPDRFLTIAG